MSLIRGTFLITQGEAAKSDAEIIFKAAFFAPPTVTSPVSFFPPSIKNLDIRVKIVIYLDYIRKQIDVKSSNPKFLPAHLAEAPAKRAGPQANIQYQIPACRLPAGRQGRQEIQNPNFQVFQISVI